MVEEKESLKSLKRALVRDQYFACRIELDLFSSLPSAYVPPGHLYSISRYYLVIFPAFMLLALWSKHERQPARNLFFVNLFVALQAVFMIFFVPGLPLVA